MRGIRRCSLCLQPGALRHHYPFCAPPGAGGMMQYDLVFKGGGAKGNAFAGALEVFSTAGHTWRRLVGTSAGAITATLVGAGYKYDELLAACSEQLPGTDDPVFTTFMDTPQASDFTD